MDEWFSEIASNSELARDTAEKLHDNGFIVIAGPVVPAKLSQLVGVYDDAVSGADPTDVSIGRSTTRVHDLVNRGPDFDGLYMFRSILGGRVVASSVNLSS